MGGAATRYLYVLRGAMGLDEDFPLPCPTFIPLRASSCCGYMKCAQGLDGRVGSQNFVHPVPSVKEARCAQNDHPESERRRLKETGSDAP